MTDLRMEDQVTLLECEHCGNLYTDECICETMILVVIESQGKIANRAYAEDNEAALLAARTLWDESWDPYFSKSRRGYFKVDGKVVATFDRRP